MIALIVVALGAIAAAVGTGVFAARSTRNPRVYFVAWTVALFGLALGLGATTLGYLAGYGALIFRAMEFGAQLIAPLSLCVASADIVARRLGSRFAMRLATGALAVISVVVLGTDPINPSVTFGTTWPDPAIYYEVVPLTVLGVIALFTTVTAAATVGIVLARSSREQSPRSESRPPLYLAGAAFAVVVPGLVWLARKSAGITLPLPNKDIFAACCALAVGLTWYGARLAGDQDLSQVRRGAVSRGRTGAGWAEEEDYDASYGRAGQPGQSGRSGRSGHGGYETGEFDEFGAGDRIAGSRRRTAGYRQDHDYDYAGDGAYGGRFDEPRFDEPPSDVQYPGLAALAAGPAERPDDHGPYSEPDRFPYTGQIDDLNRYDDEEPGRHGDRRDADPRGHLFGQITIYTLLDGRAEEFDQLTDWVVGQVRAAEPDTLVYIVHAVPTAPMQRILYEVYRHRDAYEEHKRRRYVMTFEAEQRPFVLAANVIELGLQQAKVSPLPSFDAIYDILSESGIDLTGITRSGQYEPQYEPQRRYETQPPYDARPPYDAQPQYEAPYQGWAEIRGEDSRY